MDYLKEQDEKMCMQIHGRKQSLFFNIGFITFDNTNNPKCNTKTPRCARGKNIFDMRYIFIPIHHGLHFTCAVIYMKEMKIEYYNSLCFDDVTRHGCKHKIKMQESTPQVLRDYLQKEHMKEKRIDLPDEWKLSSSLGGPKNYRYQRYFVPYKICIVSFHRKPLCFYDTNRKPLKRVF